MTRWRQQDSQRLPIAESPREAFEQRVDNGRHRHRKSQPGDRKLDAEDVVRGQNQGAFPGQKSISQLRHPGKSQTGGRLPGRSQVGRRQVAAFGHGDAHLRTAALGALGAAHGKCQSAPGLIHGAHLVIHQADLEAHFADLGLAQIAGQRGRLLGPDQPQRASGAFGAPSPAARGQARR